MLLPRYFGYKEADEDEDDDCDRRLVSAVVVKDIDVEVEEKVEVNGEGCIHGYTCVCAFSLHVYLSVD